MSALEEYEGDKDILYQLDQYAVVKRADAAIAELEARIEELTAENADLHLNLTTSGLLARMQEANQNGYECGRSLAEAERFMLEKERDAEKQRAEAAEAALAWYKHWAVVSLARERGGLWSNRDDKERAALMLEAEVDLERTRKTGGYR